MKSWNAQFEVGVGVDERGGEVGVKSDGVSGDYRNNGRMDRFAGTRM